MAASISPRRGSFSAADRILDTRVQSGGSNVSAKRVASLNSPISYVKTVPGDATSAYLVVGNSCGSGITPAPTALYRMDNISFNGGAKLTSITGGPIDGSNLVTKTTAGADGGPAAGFKHHLFSEGRFSGWSSSEPWT